MRRSVRVYKCEGCGSVGTSEDMTGVMVGDKAVAACRSCARDYWTGLRKVIGYDGEAVADEGVEQCCEVLRPHLEHMLFLRRRSDRLMREAGLKIVDGGREWDGIPEEPGPALNLR